MTRLVLRRQCCDGQFDGAGWVPLLLSSAFHTPNTVASGTAQEQWHTQTVHQLTRDGALKQMPFLRAARDGRLASCHAANSRGLKPAARRPISGNALIAACITFASLISVVSGCGGFTPGSPAPLFEVPLSIRGNDVGGAIVDTGGGFELLLKERFGLDIVDTVDVLAFGGSQSVEVTEGFAYTVGGVDVITRAAIVDPSICGCNALGFHFLRKTGLVLGIDFVQPTVVFVTRLPQGGVAIPFAAAPPHLSDFDTAFIEVQVAGGGESRTAIALLDTGATASVVRRGFVGAPSPLSPNTVDLTVAHHQLGFATVRAGLFDTPGLPDLILGTDVMRVWGDRWYYSFLPSGGVVLVIRPGDAANPAPVSAGPFG